MAQSQRLPRLRVGIDLVLVSRIVRSGQTFGERFQRRVFTDGEIDYARSGPACAYGRLAAKEAAKEALELDGIGWRDIEVRRIGRCVNLMFHGAAREAAGGCQLALSMSHDGDQATAVVIAYD